MAIDLEADSSQYVTTTDNPGATSMVVSMWIKPESLPGTRYLFDLSRTASAYTVNGLQMYINASGTVGVRSEQTTSTTTSTCSIGSWHHVLGRWNGNSYRAVAIDGETLVANTDFRSISADQQQMNIGRRNDNNVSQDYFDGLITNVGIWTGSALSSRNCLELAAGADPRQVRPERLTSYLPLINTPVDLVGNGGTMTWSVGNTPSYVADSPGIAWRTNDPIVGFTAAPVGGGGGAGLQSDLSYLRNGGLQAMQRSTFNAKTAAAVQSNSEAARRQLLLRRHR